MDTNERAAGTAHWTAAARAKESVREDRLFDDPYAGALAGDLGTRALEASERASGGENPFLPVRTKWFDDLVLTQADKVRQVVLLGAGFDTRAMRLPLPESIRWFELDAASVFAAKEPILAALEAHPACNRSVIAADLGADWADHLRAGGFGVGLPTLWIAEGLLFYLDAEAVDRLVADALRMSGTASIFAADLFGTGLLRRRNWGSRLPFCSDDPGTLFRRAGWPDVEISEPSQNPALVSRVGRTKNGVASGLDPADRAWFVLAHGPI